MPDSLAAEELVACGLLVVEAEILARDVNVLSSKPPEDLWATVSRQILHGGLSPAVHACVHRFAFCDWAAFRRTQKLWRRVRASKHSAEGHRGMADKLGLDDGALVDLREPYQPGHGRAFRRYSYWTAIRTICSRCLRNDARRRAQLGRHVEEQRLHVGAGLVGDQVLQQYRRVF